MSTRSKSKLPEDSNPTKAIGPDTPATSQNQPSTSQAVQTPSTGSTPQNEPQDENTLNTLINVVKDLSNQIATKNTEVNETAPIVSAPVTSKTLFSKFTPTRINSKYTEQSIDQLESWLEINGIKNDKQKFEVLKISIEPEIYREVSGIIKNSPAGEQYTTLKAAIIKTYTDSEYTRIKALLSGITLGDRRPSQLLSQMSNLYTGPKDRIFKELFYSRLPSTVRAIVSSMINKASTEPPIETIAQWADEINEQIKEPRIEAIFDNKNNNSLTETLGTILNLLKKLAANSFPKQRSFIRDNSRNNPRNNETTIQYNILPDDGICQYHRQFGKNKHENRKCLNDCKLHAKWVEQKTKNLKTQ